MAAVGVAPGVTTVRLSDGTAIAMADWCDRVHWSTMDLAPGRLSYGPTEVFSYMRSMQVCNSSRIATLADSSLPRTGDNGLPQGHEGLVYGWRAVIEGPRRVRESDAMAAWLATTAAILHYRQKFYAVLPLSELVKEPVLADVDALLDAEAAARLAAAQVAAQPGIPVPDSSKITQFQHQRFVLPIRLQEHLGFGVRIEPQDPLAIAALNLTLAYAGVELRLRVFLNGLWKAPVF